MRRILCVILGLALTFPVLAQEPEPEDPEPQEAPGKIRLTLDPGDHVGAVTRVLFTPDGAQLITAGADHTIHIWDPQTGELLRVLRPPGLSDGLHPALSPDGQRLAVNASYAVDNQPVKHVIYLMAVADGHIERVLERHAAGGQGVRELAFSADGKRLVSVAFDKTIRVWNLAANEPPQVIPIAEPVRAMALSPDGTRLVEGRLDHSAAIRDLKSGKVIPLKAGKIATHRDRTPVAWSPDGKTVATVSYDDGLSLWDPDGTRRSHLLPKQKLNSVAFSRDSRQVIVTPHKAGKSDIHAAYIFNVNTGKKELDFIPNGLDPAAKAGGLCVFSLDGVLAATGTNGDGIPDILVWKTANGEVVMRLTTPSWLAGPGLKAGWSANGKSVTWRYFEGAAPKEKIKIGPKGKVTKGPKEKIKKRGTRYGNPTTFDLVKLQIGSRLLAGAQFKGAILTQGPFELRELENKSPHVFKTLSPKKGAPPKKAEPLPLKVSAPIGTHNPGAHTLIGTDRVALSRYRNIHLFNLKSYKEIRNFLFRGHVRSVAPSPDGRYLLVLGGDQVLHILDSKLTCEVLSLYVNEQDWIAWTPEGYYAASPGGERLMGWTVNSGIDKEATFHPASRFRASLYRPDVIKRVLAEGSVARALAAADKARGRVSKPIAIAQVLPPEVRVTVTPAGAAGKVTVEAEAQPQGTQPITALQLLIDDRPYTGADGLVTIAQPMAGAVKRAWQIDLPPGPHDIRVLGRTDVSLGSSRGIKRVSNQVVPAKREPNLYVLAVGINAYPGRLELRAAAGDARNLGRAFRENSLKLFGKVEVKELLDKQATRAGILAGLAWLKSKATPTDVTVFYFAGHGDRTREEFYLVPQDANVDDLARTGLSRTEIKKSMQTLPGKVLVLLDACHSGAIGVLFDDLSRELIDEDCGVAVMCAARPSEPAREEAQGFFTQSVVGGLGGKAPQRNGSVFLHHLQSYVVDEVGELSKDSQHPVVLVPPWMRPFALSKPVARIPAK